MIKSAQVKPSLLTLFFLLCFTVLTNESCSVALPLNVQDTISKLSTSLPNLMNKAKGPLTPELSQQANLILASITEAAKITKGGKTNRISGLISNLGTGKVKPFIDEWRQKGTLGQTRINKAVDGVRSSIKSIKRAAGL